MPKAKTTKDTTKDLIGGFQGRIEQLLKGESYASFGEKAGLSKSQIQSIMRGGVPRIDKVAAIAKGLGVHLDWLILGEGPMKTSADEEAGGLPPKMMKQVVADMETVGKMVEHFEENVRGDEKVYTPRQVSAIVRLLCIMAYSDVQKFDPAKIAGLVKDTEK